MEIKGRRGGILGSCNRTRGYKDGGRKGKGVPDWPTPKCVKDIQKFLGLANYYY